MPDFRFSLFCCFQFSAMHAHFYRHVTVRDGTRAPGATGDNQRCDICIGTRITDKRDVTTLTVPDTVLQSERRNTLQRSPLIMVDHGARKTQISAGESKGTGGKGCKGKDRVRDRNRQLRRQRQRQTSAEGASCAQNYAMSER
jgi:hypothetical protein